jgi:hypothetical protein
MAAPPLHGCEGEQQALELRTSQLIAFDGCGSSALFDPRVRRWSRLSLANTSGDYAVAAGTGVLSWRNLLFRRRH